MQKISAAIILDKKPNFDHIAFKYFLLSANKIQSTFEFTFPDENFSFPENSSNFKELFGRLKEISMNYGGYSTRKPNYWIFITKTPLFKNWFFSCGDNCSIITTDVWEKAFSPPSLFEYLLHCIIASLIFLTPDLGLKEAHKDLRGCVIDFTRIKAHDRVDIALGYLCEKCSQEIEKKISKEYKENIEKLICYDWIGALKIEGSVAYNLKHYFNFNIHRDSGFNKEFWEKARDKFEGLPFEMLKAIFTAILTFLIAVYLFILGYK